MATLKQKIEAERAIRELLKENGMPQPDAVEFGYTCIRLFWFDTKTCVVVDVDEEPEEDQGQEADELDPEDDLEFNDEWGIGTEGYFESDVVRRALKLDDGEGSRLPPGFN
jgi:hypothetical protein